MLMNKDEEEKTNLASSPDVAPGLGGGRVGVLAEVAVLGAGGLQRDAEVDVEQADVALGARAGRVHDLVVGHRRVRRDVLVQAAAAVVGEGAADRGLWVFAGNGLARSAHCVGYFGRSG